MKYVVTIEGETFEIEMGQGEEVLVNDKPHAVDLRRVDGRLEYSLLVDHRSYEAHIEEVEQDGCQMVVAGRPYRAQLEQKRHHAGQQRGRRAIPPQRWEMCAPLPGLLVSFTVEEGQTVKQGDVVAVLESMKMNLELRARWDGVVQEILGCCGTQVCQGQILAVLEAMEQS